MLIRKSYVHLKAVLFAAIFYLINLGGSAEFQIRQKLPHLTMSVTSHWLGTITNATGGNVWLHNFSFYKTNRFFSEKKPSFIIQIFRLSEQPAENLSSARSAKRRCTISGNRAFHWIQIIYLLQITVTDDEGNTAEFPCNDWLSDTQGGGKLERELIRKLEKAAPKKV